MHIAEARYIEGYKIFIRYPDGVEGIIDFSDHHRNGVFAAWNDMEYFKAVRVNPESGTLEWPNNLDLAPEYLYSRVSGVPVDRAWSAMMMHEKTARMTGKNA